MAQNKGKAVADQQPTVEVQHDPPSLRLQTRQQQAAKTILQSINCHPGKFGQTSNAGSGVHETEEATPYTSPISNRSAEYPSDSPSHIELEDQSTDPFEASIQLMGLTDEQRARWADMEDEFEQALLSPQQPLHDDQGNIHSKSNLQDLTMDEVVPAELQDEVVPAEPHGLEAEPTAFHAETAVLHAETAALHAETTALHAETTAFQTEPAVLEAEPAAFEVQPTT
ncbi:hypothetical protein FCM35_KLT20330 [Carex littledalei]|uniref:Uncharacterized protein n=1 Tax=Carex littledalei TaxID=544730 RepID=A0A833RA35_9POAL|nr:hypothetical protein FCM35_KLT20330 [Carex littledalei]